MSRDYFKVEGSLFAETEKAMTAFCHNLFLSNAVNECASTLARVEQEYKDAVLKEDADLARLKAIEVKTYQSSLTLTAYMLDEVDGVST